jgi:hypothetical protein
VRLFSGLNDTLFYERHLWNGRKGLNEKNYPTTLIGLFRI